MRAILLRELRALFASPMGCVLLIGFVVAQVVLGAFVMPRAGTGADWFTARELTMASFFAAFPWVAAVVVPALSMRAWSEDLRGGSYQLLATLPIPTRSLVLGKFFGLLSFLGVMLLATLAWPIMVVASQHTEGVTTEVLPILGGYVGCLMLGGAFLAVGMLISAMTTSQTGAYVAALVICGALVAWRQFAGVGADQGGSATAAILGYISVEGHFQPIARGHLRLEGLLWYSSITCLALVLNGLWIGRRRHA